MEQNICHFIPFHKDSLSVHTINFVYETKPQKYERLKTESVYKMYYVCSGKGYIHIPGKVIPLSKGTIFFTFPASYFAIESEEDFSYMFISFVGLRGNMIMESLDINNNNFIFCNCDEVYDFWHQCLFKNSKKVDLISESVLLYTFSFLADKISQNDDKTNQSYRANIIKKYVDDHFTDQKFSLEQMGHDLSYNKKYISYLFKKSFGIGVIEYLNTVRIQNACTMIEQGFTSITDIADKCGYSDAQYFSKIFKAKMGIAPTQHIKNIQSDKT